MGRLTRVVEFIRDWLVTPATDESRPDCCRRASWVSERDLGHARGFEFDLGKCAHCGTYSMKVYCVAASRGAFEPVDAADLEAMRSMPAGPELWAFMRKWSERIA